MWQYIRQTYWYCVCARACSCMFYNIARFRKGYCVRTFPIKYAINDGICTPIRGNLNGSDASAKFQWSRILGASVRKNGKGNKCCKEFLELHCRSAWHIYAIHEKMREDLLYNTMPLVRFYRTGCVIPPDKYPS